jgi:tripartite-type tricarboxylate transporter receptor subunit TctC
MHSRQTIAAAIAITAAGITSTSTFAADVADLYKGRTITIAIPYGPGGTYDKYGATFARHLGKHIPGKPNVIVQHRPGAGGAKAMNYTYNVARKDGTFGIVPLDAAVVNQLIRPDKMKYDANKFQWLGSSNQTNSVLVVRSDTGVKTIQDMKNIEIIGANSGRFNSGYMNPKLAMGLLGLKGRMVTGYKGSSRSILAIEQGEAQMSSFNWLTWDSKVPHWFEGKNPFARALLQNGTEKDPALPNVPMLADLVQEKDKPLVAFIASMGPIGRGITMPPGVPKHVIKALRKAYDDMNADPAFEAELKKRRLRLIASSGEKIQAIVRDALKASSPEVIKRVRKVIFGGAS